MLRSALFVPRIASFSGRSISSPAASLVRQRHVLRPASVALSPSMLRSPPLSSAALAPPSLIHSPQSSSHALRLAVSARRHRGYYGDQYGGTAWNESRRSRWWHDFKSCQRLVFGLIAVQGVIFIMWQNKDGQWQNFMKDHFTASLHNLDQGRYHTLLTCCFSQKDILHMAVNAFVLAGFGSITCYSLGFPAFAALFLGSGITSSFAHLTYNKYLRDTATDTREMLRRHYGGVLGASGALAALFAVYACMNPAAKVLLFGAVPLPAWGALVGGLVLDSTLAISNVNDGVSHIGHIAGAVSGVFFYWARKNNLHRRLMFRGRRF